MHKSATHCFKHCLAPSVDISCLYSSLFWSVQKTSSIGDILTQAVYTSNQIKSEISEFKLYYSIWVKTFKIMMGFTMAKISENLCNRGLVWRQCIVQWFLIHLYSLYSPWIISNVTSLMTHDCHYCHYYRYPILLSSCKVTFSQTPANKPTNN